MQSLVYGTDLAPQPAGPYSQAKRRGGILAVSGQIGLDPQTGALADGFESQARLALSNLNAILSEAGGTMEDVVMLRVYLTCIGDFESLNRILAELAPIAMPARTTVYVSLPPGMHVEIDALAVVSEA
ncbi:RidA family protein [Glycomyces scopariae]